MKSTRAIISLFAVLGGFFAMPALAQEAAERKDIPLHAEALVGSGTPCKGMMPFEATVDLNYSFKRFSIHALASASYFLHKEGTSRNYNRALNVGGGVGYLFLPSGDTNLGNFEARAFVSASVGRSDYKHVSYNAGVYWYGKSQRRKLLPLVGLGYNCKKFTQSDNVYHGAFFSFGLRF